jgi:hypothetical protein
VTYRSGESVPGRRSSRSSKLPCWRSWRSPPPGAATKRRSGMVARRSYMGKRRSSESSRRVRDARRTSRRLDSCRGHWGEIVESTGSRPGLHDLSLLPTPYRRTPVRSAPCPAPPTRPDEQIVWGRAEAAIRQTCWGARKTGWRRWIFGSFTPDRLAGFRAMIPSWTAASSAIPRTMCACRILHDDKPSSVSWFSVRLGQSFGFWPCSSAI